MNKETFKSMAMRASVKGGVGNLFTNKFLTPAIYNASKSSFFKSETDPSTVREKVGVQKKLVLDTTPAPKEGTLEAKVDHIISKKRMHYAIEEKIKLEARLAKQKYNE